MLQQNIIYDVAIVGGGLAGLSVSILLAQKGHTVILFEKEAYPFHRVCGEYISMESMGFLESMGADPKALGASMITELQVSGVNGQEWKHTLPLGGFGISRFLLDHTLSQLASASGVIIHEQTKVNDLSFTGNKFILQTAAGQFQSKVACGSFGKRSNIDIKWQRSFSRPSRSKLNNYIGIKYHIRLKDFPLNQIALHTFPGGYSGIVKIENEEYNLCYLTTADNLKKAGGSITSLENDILSANPWLRKIFAELPEHREPMTISQISFAKKSQVEDHVLMIGDAAGMITPLCGNGMSMAMHGAKLAFLQIDQFLAGNTSRSEMEKNFQQQWRNHFKTRLAVGRLMQKLFNKPLLLKMMLGVLRVFPGIGKILIKKTHGKPF